MIYAIGLLIIAGAFSTIGNLLIKQAQQNSGYLEGILSLSFLIGCAFYLMNVLLFAYSLRHIEVSKAYPILAATSFLLLVVAAWAAFSEAITPLKLLGIFVIVLGIYLVSQ